MIVIEIFILACVVGMAFFALDDLWVDLLSLIYRAKPEQISAQLESLMTEAPQKKIAVMVANWQEEDVIQAMVQGNLSRVDYENFYFFLGVYPNDTETLKKAKALEQWHSRVVTVVNSKPGPTSKGQMMNECAQAVFDAEEILGVVFDVMMMHDSEDVIHPKSLQLVNHFMDSSDFLQLPVYSFNLPKNEIVGATYLDEFSEHHTKELILRSKMQLAVPSAGTGTAMSRRLVQALSRAQNGQLLKEDTLTEDYHLGNLSHRLGFRTRFLCYFFKKDGERDFVATREYFPKRFASSIRQKTRWCIGILFQGGKNLGWSGTLWDRYFLWRDRRGLYNTFLTLGSVLVFTFIMMRFLHWLPAFSFESSQIFWSISVFNLVSLCIRFLVRMHAVALVNDPSQSLMVPIRWWVANVINTWACLKAWKQFRESEKNGTAPKWVKTQHELPPGFGLQELAPESQIGPGHKTGSFP